MDEENFYSRQKKMETIYKELFSETIDYLGKGSFFFCGKKMYIRLKSCVISVDFIGTETAFNTMVLETITKSGVIDRNVTPLKMIFRSSKGESGQEKLIAYRVLYNQTGICTATWSENPTAQDISDINELIRTYIDLFSGF